VPFEFPKNSQHVAVLGQNGSGKTRFGAWLLSLAPYDAQPYIVVDTKHEELFGAIDRARDIAVGEVPKEPGLYLARPNVDDQEQIQPWLRAIWERGRVGMFFDETYNIPEPAHGGWLRALLAQGRSKRIPCICLSQRPAWVSKFIFSEAYYFSVFHLQMRDDIARCFELGLPQEIREPLPRYWSYWYDVHQRELMKMQPCPDDDHILETFERRLAPKQRWL
jgi:hypothetical protein